MAVLTPDLLTRAGRVLYGEEWQAPLARFLRVDERTMRRIAKAAREGAPYHINQRWAGDLLRAVQQRIESLPQEAIEAAKVAALLDTG